MILHPIKPHNHQLSTYIYIKTPPQTATYVTENSYRRVLQIRNTLSLIEVTFQNDPQNPQANLTCLHPVDTELDSKTVECIQNILGFNFNLAEFYKLLEENPTTKLLKSTMLGLKILRSASFYESLVEAITEQQISLQAAITIRNRLARNFSEKIMYEGKEYMEFPPSANLASTNIEELMSLGLSKNKASAIIQVSQLETSGILSNLCNSSVTDIFSELIKIKGIGKWTIQYAICKGLGRYELPLTQDHALTMGIRKLFGETEFQTSKEIDRFLSKFGKYSGYLAFYIIYFFVLNKDKNKDQIVQKDKYI